MSENLTDVFGAEATIETKDDAAAKAAKADKVKAMKAALSSTIQQDSTFTQKLHSLSGDIEVLNTLGAGKNGNIIVDKSKEDRTLKATSQIVGYKLRNNGQQSIEYTTEVWKRDDATGKYVGQVVKKNLKPGETICLARKFMTMFCARPEISFTLANGKIVSSSKASKDFAEELAAYYFTFNKDENGTAIQVNDDEVKIAVDDENGIVKAEFAETFGYLNNPKDQKVRAPKGQKFTTQDLAANYVMKIMEQQGIK